MLFRSDNVGRYQPLLETLPDDMKQRMTSSADCKRLLNSSACSSTCVMGFIYDLNGAQHKKCRFSGMLFPLTEQAGPHIKLLALAELEARAGA